MKQLEQIDHFILSSVGSSPWVEPRCGAHVYYVSICFNNNCTARTYPVTGVSEVYLSSSIGTGKKEHTSSGLHCSSNAGWDIKGSVN